MRAPSALCGPAATTSHGPKHDGAASIIQSRADRLTFNNEIQKQRFIEKHAALASHEGRA